VVVVQLESAIKASSQGPEMDRPVGMTGRSTGNSCAQQFLGFIKVSSRTPVQETLFQVHTESMQRDAPL
jgi:hypothetical protein